MAELVVTLLQRGVADLLHSPLTEADKAAAAQPLPPPMIRGNWESLSDRWGRAAAVLWRVAC
jgi:hypothetical protein